MPVTSDETGIGSPSAALNVSVPMPWQLNVTTLFKASGEKPFTPLSTTRSTRWTQSPEGIADPSRRTFTLKFAVSDAVTEFEMPARDAAVQVSDTFWAFFGVT